MQPVFLAVTPDWIVWNSSPANSVKSLSVSDGFLWASRAPVNSIGSHVHFTRFGFVQDTWQAGHARWVIRTYRKRPWDIEFLEISSGPTPEIALSGVQLQNTAVLLARECFEGLRRACDKMGVRLVHHNCNGGLYEC